MKEQEPIRPSEKDLTKTGESSYSDTRDFDMEDKGERQNIGPEGSGALRPEQTEKKDPSGPQEGGELESGLNNITGGEQDDDDKKIREGRRKERQRNDPLDREYQEKKERERELIGVYQEDIRVIADKIARLDDLGSIKEELEKLLKHTERIRDINKNEYERKGSYDEQRSFSDVVDALRGSQNPLEIKGEAAVLAEKVIKYYSEKSKAKERREEIPKCLEDLAELIMETEQDKWKTGNEYELINEKGELVQENFLAWIRSRIVYYREQNPDEEINLFSMISIPMLYRSISFGEMYDTPRYFMKRIPKIAGEMSEKGEPTGETATYWDYKREDVYEKLKEQIFYEVWLSQKSHIFDVKYRTVMGIEDQLQKAIAEIHYFNVFTKTKDRLLRLLKFPKIDKDELDLFINKDESRLAKEGVRQGSLGKAMRRLLLSYYYMSEIEAPEDVQGGNMFEKALNDKGKDRFYGSIALQLLAGKYKDKADIVEHEFKSRHLDPKEKKDFSLMDDENRDRFFSLIKDQAASDNLNVNDFYGDRKKFALDVYSKFRGVETDKKAKEALNIYNAPKKDQFIISLVNDALAETVRGTENLSSDDAKYIQAFAYSMTYWTGISARNDTKAIGFDKWSNLQNTKDYRLRQARGRGILGEIFTVFGIKRLGVNFWEGIKGEKDSDPSHPVSLLELLQGGEGDKIDIEGKEIEEFECEGYAQRQFAVDHILNGFKVFNFVLREHGMNFDKLFTVDQYGRLHFDPKEADKIMTSVWHDIRYTFDLPELLWQKNERAWWTDEKGNLVFGTSKLKNLMFSEEIAGKEDDSKGETGMRMFDRKDIFGDAYYKDGTLKQMGRNVFGYIIGKELYAHRQWKVPGYTRFRMGTIELIQQYFAKFPAKIEETEGGNVVISAPFFSKDEWKRIAKIGNASSGKLWAEETRYGVLGGLAAGVTAGAKQFFKSLTGSSGGK
ncbi:MAG: hypothetical protein M1524_03475 [Patescibacteria group bacterium]|nr:hypothetical protein [Patescibacteria group bacterium]